MADENGLEKTAQRLRERLNNLSEFAHDVAAPIVFQHFRLLYKQSGLKQGGDAAAYNALLGPHSPGALYQYDSGSQTMTCGIDVSGKLYYMRYQIQGVPFSWTIAGRRRKVLSFIWHGKRVFFKSVLHPPLQAHDIIDIDDETRDKIERMKNDWIMEGIS